jgi:hypothetical protein
MTFDANHPQLLRTALCHRQGEEGDRRPEQDGTAEQHLKNDLPAPLAAAFADKLAMFGAQVSRSLRSSVGSSSSSRSGSVGG